ncbi:hypothetical protein KQX54_005953 [Cotesia glomerata]|uniref:Uncharacterized protein n=1 Tax=Cotesia glomerata TaxID=32391 RepID=A0AAV7IWA5_COTGL|nr:hypothetical protein KQX54_005953 [Cotesia glomerata]
MYDWFLVVGLVGIIIIVLVINPFNWGNNNEQNGETKKEATVPDSGDPKTGIQPVIEKHIDSTTIEHKNKAKDEEDSSQIPDDYKIGKISEDNLSVIIDHIKKLINKSDKAITNFITNFSATDIETYKTKKLAKFNVKSLDYVNWVISNCINVLSYYAKYNPTNDSYKEYAELIITQGNNFLPNALPLTAETNFELFLSYLTLLSIYECLFENNSETRNKNTSICHNAIVKLVPEWNTFFLIDIKGFDIVKINVPRFLTNYLYDYPKFAKDKREYDKVIAGVIDDYKSSSEKNDSDDYFLTLAIIGFGVYYNQTQDKNVEANGENSGSIASEKTLGGNAGVERKESNHLPNQSGLLLNTEKLSQNSSGSAETIIQGDVVPVSPQKSEKPDAHNISDDNRQRIIEYIKHTDTKTDYSQAIYITNFSKNQHDFKQRMINNINQDPSGYIHSVGKVAINTLRYYAIPDSHHKKEILKNFVCEVIKALNTYAVPHVTTLIEWKGVIINYLRLLSMYECLIECQSKTLHKSDSICHDTIVKLVPQWNYFLGQQLTGIEYVQVNVSRLLTNYLYDHQKFVEEQNMHASEINRAGTVLPKGSEVLDVNTPDPSDDVNIGSANDSPGRSEIQYSLDGKSQSLPGSTEINTKSS